MSHDPVKHPHPVYGAQANTYSSVEEVILATGIRADDLGLKDAAGQTPEERLKVIIHGWLIEIKSMIDADRNRDYHAEVEGLTRTAIPPGIHSIARRAAGNMIALAILRRETPILKADDFSVQMVEDQVLTREFRRDLLLYPAKARFRMMRVRTQREIEEEESVGGEA